MNAPICSDNAAPGEEHLESDQPRARRAVDEGRAHDAARTAASGRGEGRWPWNRVYAPMRGALDANFPADLRKAIDASPRARKTFQSLGRQNLYHSRFAPPT